MEPSFKSSRMEILGRGFYLDVASIFVSQISPPNILAECRIYNGEDVYSPCARKSPLPFYPRNPLLPRTTSSSLPPPARPRSVSRPLDSNLFQQLANCRLFGERVPNVPAHNAFLYSERRGKEGFGKRKRNKGERVTPRLSAGMSERACSR